MLRYVCLTLFLVLAIGIRPSYNTEVTVEDSQKKLCLYANLMINFTVTYEVGNNSHENVSFVLPDKVNTTGSSCNLNHSTLKLDFGMGHSWTINFLSDNKTYKADSIVFTYNLKDDSIFKNSSSNETKSVSFNASIEDVGLNTYYSCKSEIMFKTELVRQTLWDVSIQAFINGTKSDNATVCPEDLSSTTPAPTTQVTNGTTVTTPATTPTPTPFPKPSTGTYIVNSSANGTACLMATMGLQVHYSEGGEIRQINLNPNKTTTKGLCGTNGNESSLLLISDSVSVSFVFSEDGKKFFLHTVNVTVMLSNESSFNAVGTNLTLWEASLGSSYMCNKEQTYNLSVSLALYTVDLHVQPFEVKENSFATAHECPMDDTSILIPIIVGAALAGLILIVLIAYVIAEDCQADKDESLIVPIAVGVALGVLVLTVLVAYFIGRRRNQANGYESF